MTTIHDIDDPRLTAYALGELDAAEIPAVEAFLADHAEARRLVDETRALAGTLSAELAGELAGAASSPTEGGAGAAHDAGSDVGAAGLDAGRREALVQAAASGGAAAAGSDSLRVADGANPGPHAAGSTPSAGPARPRQALIGLRPYLSAAAVLLVGIVASLMYLGEPPVAGSAPAAVAQRADDDRANAGEPVVPEQLRQLGYLNGAADELAANARGKGSSSPAASDLARRELPRNARYPDGAPAIDEATREALQELGYTRGSGVAHDGSQPAASPSDAPVAVGGPLLDAMHPSQTVWDLERQGDVVVGAVVSEAERPPLIDGQGGGGGGTRIDSSKSYDANGLLMAKSAAGTTPPASESATAGGALARTAGKAERSTALYVAPADVASTASAGGVAPPIDPGAAVAAGPASDSSSTNVSGSPGLLTGRGRRLAMAAGGAGSSAESDANAGEAVEAAPGSAQPAGIPAVASGAARAARGRTARGAKSVGTVGIDAEETVTLGRVSADAGEGQALAASAGDDLGLALHSLGYLGDARGDSSRDALRWRGRHLGGESYAPIHENPFVPLTRDPLSALSTFGVDVDRASYANVRRFLHANQAPPADAVRIEELVNAFAYDDPAPEGSHPFAVSVEAATCPWEPRHRLVKVGLSTAQIERAERPAVQLVFLLDVSGSMKAADKLPLLINSLDLLLDELDERDRVAIVTYASGSHVVLPSTSCAEKDTIRAALKGLRADGSTHASAGIQLAYQVAAEGFVQGGNNRVLMATDGDFNVGVTGHDGLHALIADKAAGGTFLTVLGFGTGNFKDDTAELLADKGNGQYAYIDSLNEAHRVLVSEMEATLVTVAKDVKLQVEFNPAHVAAYRLLGYENRALAAADFRNDKKDAGEIGAGHSVTALYEIRPTGLPPLEGTAELKYQPAPADATPLVVGAEANPELLTVNLRYKRPDGDTGIEWAVPFTDDGGSFAEADEDFRFAAAVAAFGMILRGSDHAGAASLSWVLQVAELSRSFDPHGDRAEFVRLVRTAQGLLGR